MHLNLRDGASDVRGYRSGIGFSLHLSARHVQYHVEHLPSVYGIPVSVHSRHPPHRHGELGGMLARKGARKSHFHCRGEAHVLALLREGYLFSPDRPSPDELQEAKTFGEAIAARVRGKPYARPLDEPRPPGAG
jgi:hypothetical protein